MNKFKNAPNIKIPSTNGETFELKKIKNKFLVLYFYPKDDTPGCTIETKDFNTLLSKFTKLDCAVFGISKDDMKSHDKFKEKYKVKFDLLSDEKKEALKAFKVWGKKKVMGKEFMGVIRSTFVVNKEGRIAFLMPKVNTKTHHEDVLNVLKSLD